MVPVPASDRRSAKGDLRMISMRSKRQILAAVVVAAFGAISFAGEAWSQDKVLTMPVPGDAALDNLDPRVLLTTNHQQVQIAIFDSLVRSKGTDIVPAAAESWEISPDGKTYTFHLRSTKWSDGKPVTGQDFVDAFVRMFTTSGASSIYDAIQNGAEVRAKKADPSTLGVRAPDDKTVVFTLTSPTPYFLGLLTSSYSALADMGVSSAADLPPLSLLTSEDPQNTKLVTPYIFSVLTQMGLKITLNQQTGNQFWNTLLAPALGYDLAIAGWGPDYDDPYTYMQYWQSSSTDMGTTFNNPDYDKLMQRANNETDLKKRAAILVQAEALFSDIGTSIPLLHYKGSVALQPRVKNMMTSSFGAALNYIWVDIQK